MGFGVPEPLLLFLVCSWPTQRSTLLRTPGWAVCSRADSCIPLSACFVSLAPEALMWRKAVPFLGPGGGVQFCASPVLGAGR